MEYVIAYAIALACAVWVYFDARKRDWTGDRIGGGPWIWAIGVALIWLIAFPLYLIRRRRRPLIAQR